MAKSTKSSTGHSNGASDGASPLSPTYFAEISIANTRCFGPKQSLRLTSPDGKPKQWTILLGNNGTGKTTVLQALSAFDLVRLDYTEPSQTGPERKGVAFGARALRWYAYRHRRDFSRVNETSPPQFEAVLATGASLSDQKGEFRSVEKSIAPRRWFPSLDGIFPRCFGYGVSRRSGGRSLARQVSDDATASLFSDRIALRNAEEWLLQLDYASSKKSDIKGQLQARLELVQDLLIRVVPDVTAVRFSAPDVEDPLPQVEFKTPFGWIHIDGLGYGYTSLVVWMVDLVSRLVELYPNSRDPLSEPGVVLVDEIDLHLHPSWQRHVMSYLSDRFPNIQFIVTAHSPLVVQAAPSVNANIAVLRRHGNHVVIDNDTTSVDGWRLDQILTSDLFGLPSARAAEYDVAFRRRIELLSQPTLTVSQRKELSKIERQLAKLPAGETAVDVQTMLELAKSTAELLNSRRDSRS